MPFSLAPTRRQFVTTGLAALAATPLVGRPLAAAAPEGWVLPEEHLPRIVRLGTRLDPFELHVDPNSFALYWTLEGDKAIRFAVGVGRGDLYLPGVFHVGAKKEWPSWTPTREMIARDPGHYAKYADGMPGGPTNPLGARAIYLFDEVRGDTFLRIHGTPEPWTVGSAVSNGCVRLVNEHVSALYDMVPLGARVVLHTKRAA
ncbi:L,D-transpeptidase [Paracoccaceae bacterium Fryx2]|nr:L,D-transpeptidase [Paracoccaceae bacterium Fryx2]